MNGLFYMKLALGNIKKNGQTYGPYLLTCTGSVMMFNILFSLAGNQEVQTMPGGSDMTAILNLGCIIIAFFTGLFLFYTNSFLMKRRNKEIGLYNILGMGKRHIGSIMFFETVFIGVASLALGIIGGFLLSKIVYLLLLRLLGSSVQWGFYFSGTAAVTSFFLYGAVFLLILGANLVKVHVSSPIELLKGGQTGEREPKSRWLIALVGIASLGYGYYLALTTSDPALVISAFFIAVLMVIIGTYCLFTAGCILLLKRLKKSRRFFYKTEHFISTSGLLYRMKQNAAGLSGICILSTAVLVMLSSTAALYVGMEDVIRNRFPRDVVFETQDIGDEVRGQMVQAAHKVLQKDGLTPKNQLSYRELSLLVAHEGNGMFRTGASYGADNMANACPMYVMPAEDYNQIMKGQVELSDGECMVITQKQAYTQETLTLLGETYKTAPAGEHGLWEGSDTFGEEIYYVIVPGIEQVQALFKRNQEQLGERAAAIQYHYEFDINADKESQIRIYKEMEEEMRGIPGQIYGECRENLRASYFTFYAGLLFLGIFLGILFVMATALIIYYKQVTEGYDDRERFEIMQKVGLSKAEIKSSVRSQILLMFFLPLVTAALHILMAFPILTRLLAAMRLTNVGLFAAATVGTIGIFTLVYAAVYLLTFRVYLKIVSGKSLSPS